ncbi:5'-nucleotidase, lipoprotein e(P4) family [Dongshaea marina]|uniref:5'-nucleotidase, lipoprotein e(P4) family n=1 Tax=Dongshaea marina TaxID=2047966 RepID=UPI000D3E3AB1|nr:5'-nucleotidase, lipoprotein e(P4) family [Dongshaea marina]
MKKTMLAVITTAALTVASWQATAKEMPVTTAQLENQAVLAVDWVQQSGEYRALAYQAFNSARMAFDDIHKLDLNHVSKVHRSDKLKKAVVVDLDETMVDNSAYAAWRIKHGQSYSSKTWHEWEKAGKATAIPGAVAFANYVNSHGGTMFYVSNRSHASYAETVKNLKELGFTGVNDKTVLLKTTTSDKAARRDKITSEGYKIVMLIGDNLDDFDSDVIHQSNKVRRDHVDANKALYGIKYIVLPNPTYGGWEPGMAKDYFKLSNEGKNKVRHDALNAWDGK